ncbi:MAG: hypothetical protein LDL41_26560 [Coleofasciculus sp. S288]|nr:hypothetical protein [Coleofasciculus sp. S288]
MLDLAEDWEPSEELMYRALRGKWFKFLTDVSRISSKLDNTGGSAHLATTGFFLPIDQAPSQGRPWRGE